MTLIKDGKPAEDAWTVLGDEDPLVRDAPVIVSVGRWQASGSEELSKHNGPLGVWMKSDQPPELIAHDLGRFDLIALEFPAQADGRAFSYASLLRQRHGFTGELRAVGRVIQDQLYFMQRCGFDSYQLSEDQNPDKVVRAFGDFSAAYAPAADGETPAYRRRFPR